MLDGIKHLRMHIKVTIYSRSYPKKLAYGSHVVVFCFVLVMKNFTHILQGYFTGTGAII